MIISPRVNMLRLPSKQAKLSFAVMHSGGSLRYAVGTFLRKRIAVRCEKNLSRTYDLLCRTYDLLSCTYDLLSRTYDLLCRTYDLLSHMYEIISRTYDWSSIYTASILAHRVVNYVKGEADNPSVFLLMVKTAKYLEAFIYIFKYFQSCGIPRSYLTYLSFDGKRIWHIWCNTVHERGSWKEGSRPKSQVTSPWLFPK